MPRIALGLDSGYETIMRPIYHKVVRNLMRLTNVDPQTPIIIPGEYESAAQPGTLNTGNNDVVFESSTKIVALVEDTLRSENLMERVTRGVGNLPFFNDQALGVSLRPIYTTADVNISFTYRCASRQEAMRWINEVARTTAEYRQAHNHEVYYDFPVPLGSINALAHFHQLREEQGGYGDSFGEYLKAHMSPRVHTVIAPDHDIKKSQLMVEERQYPVTGYFDFTDLPQPTKNDNTSSWTITFAYRFSYERITEIYFIYPLMIHNQLIHEDLFSYEPRYAATDVRHYGSRGILALNFITRLHVPPLAPFGGLRIPNFDEWIPRTSLQSTVTAVSWLICLEPKDTRFILNLKDLEEPVFTQAMIDFMTAQHKGLGKRGQSLVVLHLYRGDFTMGDDSVMVDEDLNVFATHPLDIRETYHLRLAFTTSYSLFTRQALRAMSEHWLATLECFQSIVPLLDVEYAQTILLAGRYLPPAYIEWFFAWLQDHRIGYQPGVGQGKPPILSGHPGINKGGGRTPSGTGYHIEWPLVQNLAIIVKQDTESHPA